MGANEVDSARFPAMLLAFCGLTWFIIPQASWEFDIHMHVSSNPFLSLGKD
ncbi:hypothetical protein GCM10011391_10620 [Pullulanibacillus camelliae]|uniref:Uncharacterized protein n=1 Tax=Pullulanibacillus camelliae TaxID=1707096 RepID=A0A8J2VNH3_9BACL|nr:hypothetical protein GCM10011391_10620 [Pullulanibacillus camelliae]